MAKASSLFPIYDISQNGIVYSDNYGSPTVLYKVKLPTIYTLDQSEYERIVEKQRDFFELLGEDVLIHKQDPYFKRYFSLINSDRKIKRDNDFIDRATMLHFNERHYFDHECYIYITKTPNLLENKGSFINYFSKSDAQFSEGDFIATCDAAVSVLENIGFTFTRLETKEKCINQISNAYNFTSVNIDELKDVSFSNASVFSGTRKIHIHTIEQLSQFPSSNVDYYSKGSNQLPVSNLFWFSYDLKHPHVCNQYVYLPNQDAFKKYIAAKRSKLDGYSVKGSNQAAINDIDEFEFKMSEYGLKGCFYHFNVLSFDELPQNIEKNINVQFSNAGFKKKENTLSRKDIFFSNIPGNGIQLASQYEDVMALLTDLEASTYSILENNYESNTTLGGGLKLCDRIYGIPFDVDIYNVPRKAKLISNMNAIVMGPPGAGKSFFCNNLFLSEHRIGTHIFIIDASYSYKLQCKVHGGLYQEFTQSSKIEFNPYHISVNLSNVKSVFLGEQEEQKRKGDYIEGEGLYDKYLLYNSKEEQAKFIVNNYLEDKISLLISLTITLIKNAGETGSKFEQTLLRMIIADYYTHSIINESNDYSFDSWFNFTQANIKELLSTNDITKDDFNTAVFLFNLKPYLTGESLGYLLNSRSDIVKKIEEQRFVVIDVKAIKNNPTLFSVVTLLCMDIYNTKIKNLPFGVRKILGVDEAWSAIASPEMSGFLKERVKVDRKYNGAPVFITQEPEDFTMSEVIKNSIIDTSDIKIFLDMGKYSNKFSNIQNSLGLTDTNVAHILSINKNLRPDAFYKEVCICLDKQSTVYGVEVPGELKAIFETDPDEVAKIYPQIEKKGVVLTALNYADQQRK